VENLLSEKEEKYMETKKATIRREVENTFLLLEGISRSHEIILTDDNPNSIKIVFNDLLKDLKKGRFKFELDDVSTDMYNNICKEYLIQLNSELNIIYNELKEFELIEVLEDDGSDDNDLF
jgi:hypothetical protein